MQQISESSVSKNWDDFMNLVGLNSKGNGDNVNATLISAKFHGAKPGVYGLTFEINKSVTKGDTEGYVFVMVIEQENEKMIPYSMTYQTKEDYSKKGIYTLDDFFVP